MHVILFALIFLLKKFSSFKNIINRQCMASPKNFLISSIQKCIFQGELKKFWGPIYIWYTHACSVYYCRPIIGGRGGLRLAVYSVGLWYRPYILLNLLRQI